MLTKQDLVAAKESLSSLPSLPLHIKRFEQDDFREPEGEEAIVLCTLEKEKMKDEVTFFISSLKATGVSDDYLPDYLSDTDFLFREIDAAEFASIIEEQANGLKDPFQLSWKGDYVQGLLLVNDWNYICVLAETTQEYISFFWEAGA